MRKKFRFMALGLISSLLIMSYASVASAVYLDVNATAFSNGAVNYLTSTSTINMFQFTSYGLSAVNNGGWTSSSDIQYNNFAFSTSATDNDPLFTLAAGATGQVFDDFGVQTNAFSATLDASTTGAFSRAWFYQFFSVAGGGTVNASVDYDYNMTLFDPAGPGDNPVGTATFTFGIGKWDMVSGIFTILGQATPFTDVISYAGTDIFSPLMNGSVSYTFADGERGFFFAQSTAFSATQPMAIPDIVDPSPVPEPSTFLLLGSGIVGLIAYRRRRSNVA